MSRTQGTEAAENGEANVKVSIERLHFLDLYSVFLPRLLLLSIFSHGPCFRTYDGFIHSKEYSTQLRSLICDHECPLNGADEGVDINGR